MRWRFVGLLSILSLMGCGSCGEPPAPDAGQRPQQAESTPAAAPQGYLRLASGLDPVHTLNRWLLLYRGQQSDGVLLAPYLAGDVTLVVRADDPRAAELARRFHATAAPLEVAEDALLRPRLMQLVRASPLLAAPGDATPARVLPSRAILIQLQGRLPGAAPSELAWVAATRTDGGYVAADALEPYTGCVPTPARFLADLPISDGHSHEVRATISRVRASFGAEPRDAFLFASQDRHEDEEEEDEEDEEAEGKHGAGVALYPTNEHCELSPGFVLSFGHVAEQVDVVSGGDGQPSLLSIVLSEGDEELEAKLYRVGQAEPLLERALPTDAPGPWAPLSANDLSGTRPGD